jgi:hypothetical protein
MEQHTRGSSFGDTRQTEYRDGADRHRCPLTDHEVSLIASIADSLDAIARHVMEARLCFIHARRTARQWIPWIVAWLAIVTANMDDVTRAALMKVWKAITLAS